MNDEVLIQSMNMFKLKILYMYFPEKLLPIYSKAHMKIILEYFNYNKEEVENWDAIKCNMELKKYKDSNEEFSTWDDIKFMKIIYRIVFYNPKAYKIALGEKAINWEDCFKNGYISIGWDKVGDLRNFADYDDFKEAFTKEYGEEYKHNKSKITQKANEVWKFFTLQPGDNIVANRGTSKIVGIGSVGDGGYTFDNSRESFKHIIQVDWNKSFVEKSIAPEKNWAFTTIDDISEKLYKSIIESSDYNKTNTGKAVGNSTNIEIQFTEDEERFFKELYEITHRKNNVILYGPPGTGKTYLSQKYLDWVEKTYEGEIKRSICTFHPSFSYEDFIEGYKPQSNSGKVSFTLQDGIFKSICKEAIDNKNIDYYLIIDEINRGNIEKIFGEMITLIEKDKRGLRLILSQSKEEFYMPSNVFIIGTMNTTDKSVKMLDAAIRRRFSFKECMPNYKLIDDVIEEIGVSPGKILASLNKSLREIEDREKQIGHSYFMNNSKQINNLNELKQVYIYEIIPLISEYCYNDYNNMSEIIGESFIDANSQELREELIYGTNDFFASEIMKKFGDIND